MLKTFGPSRLIFSSTRFSFPLETLTPLERRDVVDDMKYALNQ
jgi:hypothetical protein